MARTVAWFASPGKVKRLFWDTFAFCAVIAAYTRLQVLGKFALWDIISYMPKRCTYEKKTKKEYNLLQSIRAASLPVVLFLRPQYNLQCSHNYHIHHDRLAGHADPPPSCYFCRQVQGDLLKTSICNFGCLKSFSVRENLPLATKQACFGGRTSMVPQTDVM